MEAGKAKADIDHQDRDGSDKRDKAAELAFIIVTVRGTCPAASALPAASMAFPAVSVFVKATPSDEASVSDQSRASRSER